MDENRLTHTKLFWTKGYYVSKVGANKAAIQIY